MAKPKLFLISFLLHFVLLYGLNVHKPNEHGDSGNPNSSKYEDENTLEALEINFLTGKKAYEDKDWNLCYSNMNKVIVSYPKYELLVAACRQMCLRHHDIDSENSILLNLKNILNPAQFEKLRDLRSLLFFYLEASYLLGTCVARCYNEQNIPQVSSSVSQELVNRLQYNYMQVCAFQLERYDEAASAVYTYYMANPRQANAVENYDYYRKSPFIYHDWFVDMEEQPHSRFYKQGDLAFKNMAWKEVIGYLTTAAGEFLASLEMCQLSCFTAVHSQESDLFLIMRLQLIESLRCWYRCPMIRDRREDKTDLPFLLDVFDKLQISNRHINRIGEAARCIESYLLFQPDDASMQIEKETLLKEGAKEADFTPYPDFVRYAAEQKVVFTTWQYLSKTDVDVSGDFVQKSVPKEKTYAKEELFEMVDPDNIDLIEKDGFKVTKTEVDLGAPERVVIDDLLTKEECDGLSLIANQLGSLSDGYPVKEGATSPHTTREKYIGVSLVKAAQAAMKGEADPQLVKLYIEVTNKVRDLTARYFQLKSPLFHDFSHLVCRTAIEDRQRGRVDLSHPIHSDNCRIMSDLSCLKDPSVAYTSRDYSALLYLNEEFEGGKFIFAHHDMSDQMLLEPMCGRMVAFNSSIYHGVKAVTKGQRCSIALWFTLDSTHDEFQQTAARRILKKLKVDVKEQQHYTIADAYRTANREGYSHSEL